MYEIAQVSKWILSRADSTDSGDETDSESRVWAKELQKPDQRTEMQPRSHSIASRLSDIFLFNWMELYVSCFTCNKISISLFARLQCVEKEICEALASKQSRFRGFLI